MARNGREQQIAALSNIIRDGQRNAEEIGHRVQALYSRSTTIIENYGNPITTDPSMQQWENGRGSFTSRETTPVSFRAKESNNVYQVTLAKKTEPSSKGIHIVIRQEKETKAHLTIYPNDVPGFNKPRDLDDLSTLLDFVEAELQKQVTLVDNTPAEVEF